MEMSVDIVSATMKASVMWIASAHCVCHGGAHHSRTNDNPNGIPNQSRKGRRRPRFVRTRSLIMPTSGSLTASQMMPANAANEPMRASRPTTSVR